MSLTKIGCGARILVVCQKWHTIREGGRWLALGCQTDLMLGNPFAVYKMFGDADTALYVGRTSNLWNRFRAHARRSSWWSETKRYEIEFFGTYGAAFNAERACILDLCPIAAEGGDSLDQDGSCCGGDVHTGIDTAMARRWRPTRSGTGHPRRALPVGCRGSSAAASAAPGTSP